ncbi:MAG: hypothetical protein IPG64_18685 [Haliea sp.]|nr:hypothetical protein [Haliea sp.]
MRWLPVVLIFLSASLTMRMWSEERQSGTLEHVLTQPVGPWHFVIGKFWACITLLLLALASTLPLPITVALIANLDWGPVLGGYRRPYCSPLTSPSGCSYRPAPTESIRHLLIGTVVLCSLLYLLGSATFTGFFDDRTGETLRLLSSGRTLRASIGIIDLPTCSTMPA